MKIFKKFIDILKNRRFQKVFLIIILSILIVAGSLYLLKTSNRVYIDDSLINAPIISVTSDSPGILYKIDVSVNQKVSKGDALAIVGSKIIRSQDNGLVVYTDNTIGELVNSQTTLVEIVNPYDFKVIGTIDENKGFEYLKIGQVVYFTVDAFPGKNYWGYINEISPIAKQTQDVFNISSDRPTQQFQVYVKFDYNKYPELKNGMSAKMVVYTSTK